jgi:hypothetical protein
MQIGDGAADHDDDDAMELSEEGEIVSESGDATTAVVAADSAHVPPSSFVLPPAAAPHAHAHADDHFNDHDSAFSSHHHRYHGRPPPSSPRIKFPIRPGRPLVGCSLPLCFLYCIINVCQREPSRCRLRTRLLSPLLLLLPLHLSLTRALLRALRLIAFTLITPMMSREASSRFPTVTA